MMSYFVAWRNLTYDPVRLVLYTAGIAFAVVLMGVQYGILNAMLESNTRLLELLAADIVLVHPQRSSLMFRPAIRRVRLEQARSIPGVRRVTPLYVEYQSAELRHTAADVAVRRPKRRIRVIGVDPDRPPLRLAGFDAEQWQPLHVPGTALYDRQARPDVVIGWPETVYGKLGEGVTTELAGRQIRLIEPGFDLGFDFAADGTLIVSDRTFAAWVRQPLTPPGVDPLERVDLGLVEVDPAASVEGVRQQLRELYGPQGDVAVLSREEFIQREKRFWLMNTPIGFAFGAGMLLGFVVGMVICYQILSGNVADRLGQYATLRAIGYDAAFLNRVVAAEALLLSGLGYASGLAVVLATYQLLTGWTAMPLRMTIFRAGLLAGLTVLMCWLSARWAVRKVQQADPADVF